MTYTKESLKKLFELYNTNKRYSSKKNFIEFLYELEEYGPPQQQSKDVAKTKQINDGKLTEIIRNIVKEELRKII